MKIVILGAGQVGASVAEGLVSEENDITIVDQDPARLAQLQDRLDLRTVVGDAATPTVLRSAGAEDADMVIAVTQSDQANLVACKLAQSVFNIPTRIARLRSRDFLEDESLLSADNFAVDFALCPEQVITDYIRRLIEFPRALQGLNFARGRVCLVAVRAYHGGPLVGCIFGEHGKRERLFSGGQIALDRGHFFLGHSAHLGIGEHFGKAVQLLAHGLHFARRPGNRFQLGIVAARLHKGLALKLT